MRRLFVRGLGILAVLFGSFSCIGEISPPEGGGGGDGVSAPVVSFSASPTTISSGAASLLAWTASNATSLSIDQGVGDVTGESSATVAPASTTTYTLTATGPGGTRTATATVTVSSGTAAPAIASFTATPSTISSGGSSTLAWSVSNATSVSIDQGVGNVTGRSSATVSPASTTTYTLTATGPGGTRTATATVTVSSSTALAITSFTASPSTISAGGSSTLAWSVSNATSLSIDQGVGDVTSRSSATVSPASTITYTLTATGPGGPKTATATVTVSSSSSADATLAIDTTQGRQAISPYVYGYNPPEIRATWTPSSSSAPAGTTLWREGGNRTTAYNWTNNYSNAGSDWGPYSSDTYFGSPADGPGHAVVPLINYAKSAGLAAMVTIPIQGWVSKDASGNVDVNSPLTSRFIPNKAKKGSAFTTTPSSSSAEVYQDELANFVAQTWGSGHEIHLSLDNEPDLWFSGTHKEIQRTQPTYASYLATWVESSTAIKAAVPSAILYGPANYGWWGYVNFSGASDAPSNTGPDNMFLDWFLAQVKTASTQAGKRLLDVLDLHFYSEAQSTGCPNSSDDGVRVVSWSGDANYAKRNLDCVVAARVQSARSLSDPTYVESSSITRDSTKWSSLGQAIMLVPRINAKIAAGYPGTKLAISEYNFGGGDHISGALAQADALGILGREGAYGAMLWEMLSDSSWIHAAFRAYRNYDGAGKSFGDTAVSAASSDKDHVGVYASVDAASDSRLVLVIVHRPTLSNGALDTRSRTVKIQWTSSKALGTARAWQLTGSSSMPTWTALTAPAVSGNSATLTLPGMSVTTLELTP